MGQKRLLQRNERIAPLSANRLPPSPLLPARNTNTQSLQIKFEFPLSPWRLVDDPPQKGKDLIRSERRNVVLEHSAAPKHHNR
jgi:hypothetical protein